LGKADRIEKAFERIRLRMLSFGMTINGSNNTVVSLISRICGEGVTTVAFGLASELAYEGNTLLIDASSEGKRITEFLNIDITPISVEDIHRVDPQIKHYITKLKDPNMDILSLSIPDKRENNFIDFNEPFWKGIRSYYKSIVVDSGSLQKPSSRIWANWTDHTLLVVDTTTTTQEILKRFNSDLSKFDIKLSGFILNKRSFHIPDFLWSKIC